MIIVLKKDGTLFLCLDPSDLNKAFEREDYQIPSLREILSKVSGSTVFSTLNCSNGFWQVRLESAKICVLNTPFGRYRFNVLPYGISSDPEVFSGKVEQLIHSVEGVGIYSGELLIWSKYLNEYNKRLQTVFKFGSPEIEVLKKDMEFHWDQRHDEVLYIIKKILSIRPV